MISAGNRWSFAKVSWKISLLPRVGATPRRVYGRRRADCLAARLQAQAIIQSWDMILLMRLQRLAPLGCNRAQVCSICSIALRELCKEMRLFGGLRSVLSIDSALPAFIASMRSAGNTSARVENASGDLGESETESVKVASSITNLMLPWISGPEVEKYRLGGEPG